MTDRSRLVLAWVLLIVGIAAVVVWYLQLQVDTPRITFEPVPGSAGETIGSKAPETRMTNVPPTAASGVGGQAK